MKSKTTNFSHDQEYINMVKYILENGVHKTDRTGTGTISIFDYQMRFDLSDGSIPLLTTKKMFTKGIIHELLWFISGSTNNNDLKKTNTTIWDEWADDNGQLGPLYGQMLRSFPPPIGYFPIPTRNIVDNTITTSWIDAKPIVQIEDGKHSGKLLCNKQNLKYQILGVDGTKDNAYTYAIKFLESGWIKYGVRTKHVLQGNFVDQSIPSVYNVGILGDYDMHNHSDIDQLLRKHWENMISRCYNTNDKSFSTHGNGKVLVCNRWKVLSDFLIDVKKLPNWTHKINSSNTLVLDKDYYGINNLYHPDTCVWISHDDNRQYRKNTIPIKIITTNGTMFFPSVNSACNHFGVNVTLSWMSTIRNRYPQIIDVSVYDDPNFVIRKLNFIDQLSNLINEIKHNPDSRRLFVSYWNPALLPIMSNPTDNSPIGRQNLAPCHLSFQCYVANGTLSMKMYQRSCDTFLGVPFNIAQYTILLHMLAQVCNLKPGMFIWDGGDVHIYTNHLEQCKTQIEREPYKSPKLVLNPSVTDIFQFKYDDFSVIDYQSHSVIRAPVSK